MNLSDTRALTFDCYGTLVDWEAGILNAAKPWLIDEGMIIEDYRILEEFARAESRIERGNPTLPYSDVLRHVHHALARAFGAPEDINAATQFAQSVGDWPLFPDTVAALRDLKGHYKLVLVSNADHACMSRTEQRLGVEFDAIIIAEDVGAYKPDHRMFRSAIDTLAGMGLRQREIVHVAQSLYHDHVPAKTLGLTTVWIDRYRGKRGHGATMPPDALVRPDFVVTSLRELVDLIPVTTR